MKPKTHQAHAKRLKVTKSGKMIKRYGGQDHFNARDTGKQSMKKRRDGQLSESYRRSIKRLMPHAGA